MQRLILGKSAAYGALARHIWAHVTIEGNICMGKSGSDFQTGIDWFARGHLRGARFSKSLTTAGIQAGDGNLPGLARRICTQLQKDRLHQQDVIEIIAGRNPCS